jgi:dolichol-phosphate mannosyltransferase
MSTALDIVIPVFNEGENIVAVLNSLQELVRRPFTVFICYDFDEDNTLAAIQRREWPFAVELVRNPSRGAHAAVRRGWAAGRSPCVVVFPADDTINARILDAMVTKYDEGCDIVAASRFMRGGSMVGCPLLKSVLVRTAGWTLHRLARIPTHDATNGFRLFSRRILETIPIESSKGFTYSLELLVKAHRAGRAIGEVPANWVERKAGKSRFKVLRWIPAYLRWYVYAFGTRIRSLTGGGITRVEAGSERPR